MRVLLVDNEPESYESFRINLLREQPGIEIGYADSAVTAFAQITARRYDLIVLDQLMGGGEKNGTALLRRLRDENIGALPQIIFVTAKYDELPTHEILGLDVPIALFLEKDATFGEMLLVAVRLVLRKTNRAVRYTPEDLFTREFLDAVLDQAGQILRQEWKGYYSIDQQRQIGVLVRSYVNSLRMRSEWDEQDVLELSIFLTQSLCRVFKLPESLVEILRRFLNIEEILYTIPHYRDHFFHQVKVFLLGFCVVNALNKHDHVDGTVLADRDGMKLWFMASVFHDIGYPFEKMADWVSGFIEGTLRSPAEKDHGKALIPVVFHWGALLGRPYHMFHLECIVRNVCEKYAPNKPDTRAELLSTFAQFVVESPDHGLYSALIGLNFLRFALRDDQADMAAVAIALHNDAVAKMVTRVVGQMTFERDPLSFLLAYCDLAQDWGRMRPLGLKQGHDDSFGFPVFVGGPIFAPESRTVRVVLQYPREMDAAERSRWHKDVYERFIEPARNCWAVSLAARPTLTFCIDYQGRSADGGVTPLARLQF